MAAETRRASLIKDCHRISQLVVAQRQDGFIDHHDCQLSICDWAAACIRKQDFDGGLSPWFQFRIGWCHLQIQGPLQSRDAQLQLPGGVGWPRRYPIQGFAALVGTSSRTHQVHLDMQIGDMGLLNRHLQGDGAILNSKTLTVKNAAAADRHQPFCRVKRRLHQDLGGIARLVGLLIRYQINRFLLDRSGGWLLSTAHPASELALVLAPLFIGYHRSDLVASA